MRRKKDTFINNKKLIHFFKKKNSKHNKNKIYAEKILKKKKNPSLSFSLGSFWVSSLLGLRDSSV